MKITPHRRKLLLSVWTLLLFFTAPLLGERLFTITLKTGSEIEATTLKRIKGGFVVAIEAPEGGGEIFYPKDVVSQVKEENIGEIPHDALARCAVPPTGGFSRMIAPEHRNFYGSETLQIADAMLARSPESIPAARAGYERLKAQTKEFQNRVQDGKVSPQEKAGLAKRLAETRERMAELNRQGRQFLAGNTGGRIASSAGESVLITDSGSCYHRQACGRGDYYPVALEEAKRRGLRRCLKCF